MSEPRLTKLFGFLLLFITVYAWGRIEKGRCGLGKVKSDVNVPRIIPVLQNASIEKIYAGDAHNFAITSEKRVYSWGINKYGQCGSYQGSSVTQDSESFFPAPVLLEHIRGVDEILLSGNCAAGFSFFLISELKFLLFQHIRDLTVKQVARLLATPAIHPVLSGKYLSFHFESKLYLIPETI